MAILSLMIFLLWLFAPIMYTIHKLRNGLSFQSLFKEILIISLLSIPLIGGLVGTVDMGHGMSVPWFVVGFFSAVFVAISMVFTAAIYKLFE